MIGRFSFGLLGTSLQEALAGLEVKIKDERTEQFIASTNPVAEQLKIIDNHDGAYYVDGWTMSIFSVYVGSDEVPQEELQYQVPNNDQVLTHIEDADSHRVIDDESVAADKLWSADKINTELGGKSDSNHAHDYSPSDHNHNEDYSDINHDHSGVYATADHTHSDDVASLNPLSAHLALSEENVGKIYHYDAGRTAQVGTSGIYAVVKTGGAGDVVRLTLAESTWDYSAGGT